MQFNETRSHLTSSTSLLLFDTAVQASFEGLDKHVAIGYKAIWIYFGLNERSHANLPEEVLKWALFVRDGTTYFCTVFDGLGTHWLRPNTQMVREQKDVITMELCLESLPERMKASVDSWCWCSVVKGHKEDYPEVKPLEITTTTC